MKDSKPIDGMTPDEWIIYNKGYTRGLKIGEVIGEEKTEERIIKLLTKHGKSNWCGEGDCPRPFPTEHFVALIKGENK